MSGNIMWLEPRGIKWELWGEETAEIGKGRIFKGWLFSAVVFEDLCFKKFTPVVG